MRSKRDKVGKNKTNISKRDHFTAMRLVPGLEFKSSELDAFDSELHGFWLASRIRSCCEQTLGYQPLCEFHLPQPKVYHTSQIPLRPSVHPGLLQQQLLQQEHRNQILKKRRGNILKWFKICTGKVILFPRPPPPPKKKKKKTSQWSSYSTISFPWESLSKCATLHHSISLFYAAAGAQSP